MLAVLVIKHRASHMLGKQSTTELYPASVNLVFLDPLNLDIMDHL